MNPGAAPNFALSEPAEVPLPAGGTTLVWDSGTNDGAHVVPVLLIHGWNIDAPTNYGYAFPHLAEHHRVIMFDLLGHGHGPRRRDRFTLEAAADDAVAVLDAVGVDRAVICGFSLGGAVAQTVLRKYSNRCAGLVLSATAATFAENRRETAQFVALGRTAQVLRRLPEAARERVFTSLRTFCTRRYPAWIGDVVASADPVNLLEAGASLGQFNRNGWIGNVDVPSAFIVTSKDSVVPPRRQVELAEKLNVDAMHNVAADHDVPIRNDDDFHAALHQAVATVTVAATQAH